MGLPYYVFTCGPDTDELALLASTVPNMGKTKPDLPKFPLFEDMMMDPASALSIVNGVYQEEITQEDRMGWCDGRQIGLNYGNGVTESFLTLEQKNMSMAGIQGHECGHKNYSDFALREKYLEGFFAGIWYPYPPTPESEQEEAALEQMKGYLERRDEDALALIVQVASYLQNLLEDMYIEEKMCARFPGSVRKGILLNRGRNLE